MNHPCPFSDIILNEIAKNLHPSIKSILDPFAGTGKIAKLKSMGYKGEIICNDIEESWDRFGGVDEWLNEDAENLHFLRLVDAIITSPTYGNRMADHHKAKDDSKRITYTHKLGKDLHPQNTGKMQWSNEYKEKHERVYRNLVLLIKEKGFFILNISNHIRNGKEINVSSFHIDLLTSLGLVVNEIKKIKTKRMRFGENSKNRVSCEYLIIMQKGG